MYVFKDHVVLDCLHRMINAYGKIGEYIRIEASPTHLQFSVVNSSSTVIGRAELPATLFSGPGATKTVQLKARALDFVLKRIESEEVGTLKLRFRVARSGQEQVEIFFVEPNGVSKQFRINCMETVVLPLDFDEVPEAHCTFSCLPAVLKDAFASCETSADEAKMQFSSQFINILAKRRGAATKKASVLSMGLKTTVKLQPTAFRQLTVLTPWQAEFKLKEFRVMLAFLWQLSAENPVNATFDFQGPTTPFVFHGYHPSCPQLTFVFKFMARVSAGRNAEASTWLRVGPQPESLGETSHRDQARNRYRSIDAVRRERATRVRHLTEDFTPSLSPLSTTTDRSQSMMDNEPLSETGAVRAYTASTPATATAPSAAPESATHQSTMPPYTASSTTPAGATEPVSAQPTRAANQHNMEQRDGRGETELVDENEAIDGTLELGFTQAEPVARGLFD